MYMRYPPLLIALFVALLVNPLTQRFTSFELPAQFFLALVFLATIYAFRNRRFLVTCVALMGISALALRFVGVSQGRLDLFILGHGVSFVIMAIIMFAIMIEVLGARTVSSDLVAGAVCLYLIIGMAWAFFYYWLSLLSPGSVFALAIRPGSASTSEMEARFAEILYFSFSSLTSIGSSGEEALTRMARQLAVVEAATGQLYLAVLVSRLVGFNISSGVMEPRN